MESGYVFRSLQGRWYDFQNVLASDPLANDLSVNENANVQHAVVVESENENDLDAVIRSDLLAGESHDEWR